MTKKIYTSKSVASVRVQLGGGLSALVRFAPEIEGGSKFETTDTALQGALEAHPKYGKLFGLESSAESGEDVTRPKVQYYVTPRHIPPLIPDEASATNQLADKDYVNEKVTTDSATFRGTYDTLAELEAVTGADNNDYGFVIDTDADGNTFFKRYKFNGTSWLFEFNVSYTDFSASEWAAIKSGITSGKVGKLDSLPTNEGLANLLNGKENASNKVTELTQQGTDTQYPSAKAVYDFVKEETGKARETVVVTATADTGDVSADAVITVKVDNVVVGTGTGALTLAVEYGKQYVVECSRVYDYLTPAAQTFTAGQSVRNVTCAYTYIARDVITIDQTDTDETAMVTGDVQGTVIQAIRSNSHLYLGKQTETGNQLICQLSDSDGTKYADGTNAALDGSEGDQWMKLPVFWWKVIPGADAPGTVAEDGSYDKYAFAFAFAGEPDPTWKKWEGDKNLLGAKKMYVSDGKGYSRSGVQGSANFTQATGNSYAAARGTGYSCVTWEWQWMMCVLFYAWYGRMNSQAQCGTGSNTSTRTLGSKDSLGMTDTTSSNGNTDNTKFWGIENWWGDLSEWIGNVTSSDYVITIKDMNTGENRTVSGWYHFEGTGGYASRFKVTENLDFIPRAKSATETTSYCDWVNGNTGSRVVFRSSNFAYTYGGVACVYSSYAPSYTYSGVGSRLAFNGTVTEAESVAAYKAA